MTDALTQIVRELGPDVLTSPQRLRAALSDVIGLTARSERGAIDALVLAVEDGVPQTLMGVGDIADVPTGLLTALSTKLLNQGISRELATTTVTTLADVVAATSVAEPLDRTVLAHTRVLPVVDGPSDGRAPATPARPATSPGPTGPGPTGPGPAATPPARASRRGGLVAGVGALVVVLIAVAIGALMFANRGGTARTASTGGAATSTDPPGVETTATTTTVTHTATRAAPKVSGDVTADDSHFKAVDAEATITPRVSAGGPCVDSVPLSARRYRACSVTFPVGRFTRHTAVIDSVRLLSGDGRATLRRDAVVFRPGGNGPYTARISVRVHSGHYVSTAILLVHVLANEHFAPNKDFPG